MDGAASDCLPQYAPALVHGELIVPDGVGTPAEGLLPRATDETACPTATHLVETAVASRSPLLDATTATDTQVPVSLAAANTERMEDADVAGATGFTIATRVAVTLPPPAAAVASMGVCGTEETDGECDGNDVFVLAAAASMKELIVPPTAATAAPAAATPAAATPATSAPANGAAVEGSHTAAGPASLISAAKALFQLVEVRDRRYLFRLYRRCIVGRQAVQALLEADMVETRLAGVHLCYEMLAAGTYAVIPA